jgi:hypothetical protein
MVVRDDMEMVYTSTHVVCLPSTGKELPKMVEAAAADMVPTMFRLRWLEV